MDSAVWDKCCSNDMMIPINNKGATVDYFIRGQAQRVSMGQILFRWQSAQRKSVLLASTELDTVLP